MGFNLIGKPMTTQPDRKPHLIKEAFLAKEWNSFHLFGKKLDYLHLKDLLTYECGLYLKQPLTPPQHKIIVAYNTIDLPLKLDNGQLSLSLEILDYDTSAPTMQFETRHIYC